MTALIFYATVDGHTKKIAQTLAADWQGNVQVESIERLAYYAGDPSIENIVIGASIRYGHFSRLLIESVKEHVFWLKDIHSSFYSVNLTARKPGKNDPATSPYVRKFLKKTSWHPDQIAMFAGNLCYPKYRFFDKQMIRLIMTMTGGCNDGISTVEYTDWNEVHRFAKTVSGLALPSCV